MAIAGNKSDLEKRRIVKRQDALDFAKSVGATHFDTSAKAGRGLNEAFLHLARGILKQKQNDNGPLTLGTGTGGRKRGGRGSVKAIRIREDSIDEDAVTRKKSGGCC